MAHLAIIITNLVLAALIYFSSKTLRIGIPNLGELFVFSKTQTTTTITSYPSATTNMTSLFAATTTPFIRPDITYFSVIPSLVCLDKQRPTALATNASAFVTSGLSLYEYDSLPKSQGALGMFDFSNISGFSFSFDAFSFSIDWDFLLAALLCMVIDFVVFKTRCYHDQILSVLVSIVRAAWHIFSEPDLMEAFLDPYQPPVYQELVFGDVSMPCPLEPIFLIADKASTALAAPVVKSSTTILSITPAIVIYSQEPIVELTPTLPTLSIIPAAIIYNQEPIAAATPLLSELSVTPTVVVYNQEPVAEPTPALPTLSVTSATIVYNQEPIAEPTPLLSNLSVTPAVVVFDQEPVAQAAPATSILSVASVTTLYTQEPVDPSSIPSFMKQLNLEKRYNEQELAMKDYERELGEKDKEIETLREEKLRLLTRSTVVNFAPISTNATPAVVPTAASVSAAPVSHAIITPATVAPAVITPTAITATATSATPTGMFGTIKSHFGPPRPMAPLPARAKKLRSDAATQATIATATEVDNAALLTLKDELENAKSGKLEMAAEITRLKQVVSEKDLGKKIEVMAATLKARGDQLKSAETKMKSAETKLKKAEEKIREWEEWIRKTKENKMASVAASAA